jgi:hypothetical protein
MALFRRNKKDDRAVALLDPTRCPDCGGRGVIGYLDLVEREATRHCPACGTMWVSSTAEEPAAR